MELTNKQLQGLRIAIDRYKHHEAYTVISGFAGTGKTTLIRFIIDALDLEPDDVAYISYTGKAAMVLQENGCPGAQTAHRLLYKSIQKQDGTFIHIPRYPLPPYKLIVVDEVSMLPKDMWELLLTHKIHVIASGDPEQLPAITEGTDVLNSPHIFLDEIMRQAEESEIIRLSAAVRAGKVLTPYTGSEINVVRRDDYIPGMLDWADQIICSTNATRRSLNKACRERIFGELLDGNMPIEGDKIICLRNNWDISSTEGDPLVNGMGGTLLDFKTKFTRMLPSQTLLTITFQPEDMNCVFNKVQADWQLLTTGEPTVTKDNFRTIKPHIRPMEFDYGYAITAWKAQGSEWDKVLVFEEDFPRKREDHRRALYTAITRAKKKLTLIMK